MPVELVAKWLGALALLISIMNTFWAYLTREARTAIARQGELASKVISHDRRIQGLEHDIKHMPSKEEIHQVKLDISEMRGAMGRMEESVSGMSKTVDRIDDYLRTH